MCTATTSNRRHPTRQAATTMAWRLIAGCAPAQSCLIHPIDGMIVFECRPWTDSGWAKRSSGSQPMAKKRCHHRCVLSTVLSRVPNIQNIPTHLKPKHENLNDLNPYPNPNPKRVPIGVTSNAKRSLRPSSSRPTSTCTWGCGRHSCFGSSRTSPR